MRKVKFEEFYKKPKLFLMEREKKVRRKPRDKEEEKILDILLILRLEKFFKKGIIKPEGKRKYILKI